MTAVLTLWLMCVAALINKAYAYQKDTTFVRCYIDIGDVITHHYYRNLLNMALKETQAQYGPFKVIPVMKDSTLRQGFRDLRTGRGIDVMYSMMSFARKWVLKAIKIPLTKGYIGYRLIMVNQADKNQFANLTTVNGLKKFRMGQGYDWIDTQILKSNGLDVVTSRSYDSLLTMLSDHTIDGFPRGIFEIYNEVKDHPQMHFAVANGIYLQYPQDFFFYVKKDNLNLARRIREGLLAGMKDGSFDHLFDKYIQPFIDAAHLDKRHVIKLSNPEYDKLLKDNF